jgi:hypothetical protein
MLGEPPAVEISVGLLSPPVSTPVETPPWPCHIVGTTDQAPPPYAFSRYRWNIRQIGTSIQFIE